MSGFVVRFERLPTDAEAAEMIRGSVDLLAEIIVAGREILAERRREREQEARMDPDTAGVPAQSETTNGPAGGSPSRSPQPSGDCSTQGV